MKHALPFALLVFACQSPVEEARIAALGPELDDVAPGEFHRPGQPCLYCHGGYAREEPIMAVAGTVFATPHERVPVADVTVRLTDARGETRTATTNCVGNFFLEQNDWQPVFPLRASVICPRVPQPRSMASVIGREGSCAHCHQGQASLDSPGWVFCSDEMPSPPYAIDPSCPGRVP
jgi:hypothetical protein